jgi:pyruvate kinase
MNIKLELIEFAKYLQRLGKTVGILLLDTKGPEIRTHNMKDGAIELRKRYGSHRKYD